jgi:hypothetical protein
VTRTAKKLAVTLANGEKPTIGTTLTPVKAKKASAKKVAKAEKPTEKVLEKVPERHKAAEKPAEHIAKTTVKAAKKLAKAAEVVKKTRAKKAAKVVKAPKKASPPAPVLETPPPAVALKRGRQPVNPEAAFAQFQSTYRVGSKVPGEVTAFTSHGAVIKVELKNDQQVECYAPTTLLGSPPPARARDVLKRGDKRTFRLMNVDSARRIAELALL